MRRDEQPLGQGAKAIFLGVGLLTLIVGLTMFVVPGPAGVGSASATAPATDQWWPWSLRTAFNTRFLGAFWIAVAVGALWAARQQQWADVRALFPPGLTFTFLATVAALIHLSSFRRDRLATWLFFVLYGVVLMLGFATFVRYERRR